MSKTLACLAGTLALVAACATTPKTPPEREALRNEANATLQSMTARDAGLAAMLDQSAGYVVFPEIGKGGALVGGAFGRGVVYQGGRPVGFASLNQASIGAQLGGQTFSEIIVFENLEALNALKDGKYNVSADASAIVLTTGAARKTQFQDGVAIFVVPRGGLMVDLSVGGQRLKYEPRG